MSKFIRKLELRGGGLWGAQQDGRGRNVPIKNREWSVELWSKNKM